MSEMRPAAGLPLTAIFRRREDSDGFIALVAELPNVDAQGDTLAATLENLKQSIVTFLTTNRDRSFRDLADNAVTEIVLLEAATSFPKSAPDSPAMTVTDLLRIPVPINVHFGSGDDQRLRSLFDASVIVRVTFDTQRLSDVLRWLNAAQLLAR